MKVLVCGGRVRVKPHAVEAVLDKLAPTFGKPLVIIHGAAKGTDSYAGFWAEDRGHKSDPYPVDGKLDGYSEMAPKMRNHRMLDQGPEIVVAFPGGPGTRHMIDIAQKARVPIYDVELDDGIFRVFRWGKTPKEKATLIAQGSYG